MLTPEVDLNDDVRGFIHTWVEKLSEHCTELHVIALNVRETNLPQNVFLYSLDYDKKKIKAFLKLNRFFIHIFWSKKIDIIFTHMMDTATFAVISYTKLLRKPIIWWKTHGHVSLKFKILNKMVTKVLTASDRSFRIKSKKKIVVGHGIDTEYFRAAESDLCSDINSFNLLSVGRISPSKDYETMIKAINILVKQNKVPYIKLKIVGSPFWNTKKDVEYFNKIKSLSEILGLQKYVEFCGDTPYREVVEHYQNCCLSINASHTGSVDKAVLEAMACAKPVLTSNEAFYEVLGKYSDKLMFETGSEEGLAKKIFTILSMPSHQYKELGSHLREITVRDHSLDRLMKKITDIFKETIHSDARTILEALGG
ncbi:MAG: glycosyltransferase family 4 protein [Nitrospirota bacterium]